VLEQLAPAVKAEKAKAAAAAAAAAAKEPSGKAA